jgi:hypothetical protein
VPSAEALKFANELLDPWLPRDIQAELPDLAKPQGPYSAPPAPQGDDLQLWPESKLVTAPTSDDPLLARLRNPFR